VPALARRRLVAAALALSLLAAACGSHKKTAGRATTSSTSSSTTSTGATTAPTAGATTTRSAAPTTRRTVSAPPNLAAVRIRLTQVANFDEPLAMAVHPGDNRIFVAQRGGQVRALDGGQIVLDVSSTITASGQEQGLLGIAFSPDGSHLYVDYTDHNGDTRVVEYAFAGNQASSPRQLLFVDQPDANHNGGNVIVGPDGKLWIGMGDGGGAGDVHSDGSRNNAQNLATLLGKLLRIDPTPSGGAPYTVPADNPFVGRAGARGEIWAYGLRNPWRFEFDRTNRDLWIGDVGQGAWEEIDWRPASSKGGENYGWNKLEGTHSYNGGSAPPGSTLPVEEYSHDGGGCAVTGGFVYRGSRLPNLQGAYVYADFCIGELHALVLSDGRVTARRDLGVKLENLSSFGQDASGELYALSLSGAVTRIDPA